MPVPSTLQCSTFVSSSAMTSAITSATGRSLSRVAARCSVRTYSGEISAGLAVAERRVNHSVACTSRGALAAGGRALTACCSCETAAARSAARFCAEAVAVTISVSAAPAITRRYMACGRIIHLRRLFLWWASRAQSVAVRLDAMLNVLRELARAELDNAVLGKAAANEWIFRDYRLDALATRADGNDDAAVPGYLAARHQEVAGRVVGVEKFDVRAHVRVDFGQVC